MSFRETKSFPLNPRSLVSDPKQSADRKAFTAAGERAPGRVPQLRLAFQTAALVLFFSRSARFMFQVFPALLVAQLSFQMPGLAQMSNVSFSISGIAQKVRREAVAE